MKQTIALVGSGRLATLVRDILAPVYTVVTLAGRPLDIPGTAGLVLFLSDEWLAADECELEKGAQAAAIPRLRAFTADGEGIVGPLVRPGMPGCFHCADQRLQVIGNDADDTGEASVGLRHVAYLVAAEAANVLTGNRTHTQGHLYIVRLSSLNTSLHAILPDATCAVCGEEGALDPVAAARIVLQPVPKPHADHYRSRTLDDLRPALIRDYYDSRTGLLTSKLHDLASPFATVHMKLPSFALGDQIAGGRSHSYAASELTAILEGLERFCGQTPRGGRYVVSDSLNRLRRMALDPRSVGLYSAEQYALPDFPYEPFDPDSPLDWVWGYSLTRERPILVPESLAYYSSYWGGGVVQEGSNGCALGGSVEEAILYGMLEIVERDSFLMSWYGKLPVARLDPASAEDPELLLMLETVRAVTGYEVQLFNITMENGVPAIWALARSERPDLMRFVCGAGAHVDPIRAAKNAVYELASMIVPLNEAYASCRADIAPMYDDSSLVRQMEHHPLVNGLPQAEERFAFVLEGQARARTFAEEFRPKAKHADLTDDLKEMLDTFRRLQLEVIVVNQSSPEITRNRLHCVKVIVPGMLPMTFGHHLIRITGMRRLLEVPCRMGYVQQSLSYEQLNPHPHPFF
jgi:ribosomal protein S12 methylthiotransferase accessory factor